MIQDRTYDLTHRGGIEFIEENHLYLNDKGEQYTSSTSLIKKFKQPFDQENIAKYKAIKNILPTDKFDLLKKHAGGWENVYKYYDKLIERPEYADIAKEKDFILVQWASETLAGTEEHARREKLVLEEGVTFNGIHYPHGKKTILDITPEDRCVLTEVLVWDHEYKIGGLMDLLIADNGTLTIPDYKTNKKIDMTSFMYKRMLFPVHNLLDCNYFHYSLQLSLYMKMACRITGLKPGDTYLINTANESYGRKEDITIPCADLSEEIEKILAYK